MTKTIAIIGAGGSGMTSVKACLEQNLKPVVFEKTDYTGGLWRYQETVSENGIASVMKSTIINTSKEMSAFSDFPPPDEFPNFMHNTKMVAYLDMYAEKFEFLKYVNFNHQVLSVNFADDYETTGRWTVAHRNLKTNAINTETFDGIMVCTGHHTTVNMPRLKGQEKFKGTIMHTHSLKHARGFENKVVVVVGIGNSGGDAAVELSSVAEQVYLSTRRGSWIQKRVGPRGLPGDINFHRRWVSLMAKLLPYDTFCGMFEKKLNKTIDHEEYQLKPKHRVFSQHSMVQDALPNRILSGTIQIKSDIDYLTEEGVVFQGESKVIKCDAIVLATGYKIEFPFISQDIFQTEHNKIQLYKYQFIHHLKHPHTLAFISLIQPLGAIFPIGELQARWFAQLMVGNRHLPSKEVMEKNIEQRLKWMKNRYYDSDRHTIQVDWLPFMNELAKEIGAHPPILKYLFTDFKLFLSLLFEPMGSYQFRLVGPNSWSGAREAQLNLLNRVKKALKTKQNHSLKVPELKWRNNYKNFKSIALATLLAFVCSHFVKLIFEKSLKNLSK